MNAFSKPNANEQDFEFDFPEDDGLRIPEGDQYIGRITGITKGTAKSSGNPMFTWDVVITEGPHASRDFKLFTALSPQAMWKVAETLAACGKVGTPGQKMAFKPADVVNVMVRMVIADDEYNGRKGSKLQGLLPHPKGAGYRRGGLGTPVAAAVSRPAAPAAAAAPAQQTETEAERDEEGYLVEYEIEGQEGVFDSLGNPIADEDRRPEEPEPEEIPPAPPVRRAVPAPKAGKAAPTIRKK